MVRHRVRKGERWRKQREEHSTSQTVGSVGINPETNPQPPANPEDLLEPKAIRTETAPQSLNFLKICSHLKTTLRSPARGIL